jgi:hypothetical protein
MRNRCKILIRKPEMKRPLVEAGMEVVVMMRVLLLDKGCDIVNLV